MADLKMNIKQKIGIVADHNGNQLQLNIIAWENNKPKADLRVWYEGKCGKGMTFSKEEIDTLNNLISKTLPKKTTKKGRPKKSKSENATETKKASTTSKNKKILQFPKQKPIIEPSITDGSATYDECLLKINNAKKNFPDSDSQYVLDGILELCKVDQNFRNNVMLKNKTYSGAMEYMMKKAKDGYSYKLGNGYFMDRDMGLAFTIDYFNERQAK